MALRIAEDLHLVASRLLDAEVAEEDLPGLLHLSNLLVKEIGHFQSAVVHDARLDGMSWKAIGAAAQISPATARERWNPQEVQRRLERRDRERAASHGPPQPTGSAAMPRRNALDDEPVARASKKLAAALSFLHRRSSLLVLEAAAEADLSPSHLSRILTGERLPVWPVVEALAEVYQADANDLRILWEASSGVVLPARDSVTTAADRLRAALRGLHLAAGSPPHATIHDNSRGLLAPEVIAGLLHGRSVPGWRQTSRLVTALGGIPGDIRPLWEALHYSFLATTIDTPPITRHPGGKQDR